MIIFTKRYFSNGSKTQVSKLMTPFSVQEPFNYLSHDKDSDVHFATYKESANQEAGEAKALAIFLHDFGVSAKDFGGLCS